MKRLLAILLALAMVFTFAACGGEKEKEANNTGEPEKKVLRIGVDTDPGAFSIHGTSSSSDAANLILELIYDKLVDSDKDFKPVPGLATSWDKIDNTHFRMHLQPGVTDIKGNKIDAEDVLWSFKFAAQDAKNSLAVKYIDLDQCVVEDPNTLLIVFSEENPFQFRNMTTPCIVSQKAYEEDPEAFDANPYGSGPYQIASYVPGSKLVLEARKDYWGGTPNFDSIEFLFISEPSQRTTALESGEIDMDKNLQSSDVEYVSSVEGLNVISRVTNKSEGFWLNQSEYSVLNDLSLREAVCYAIDNEAICSLVYKDLYAPAVSVCPPSTTDYVESFNSVYAAKQDMAKAQELVEKAGAKGKPITIATTGRADRVAAAEMIQTWLNEAGFDASIKSYEDAVVKDVMADPASGWDISLVSFMCGSNYVLDMYNAYIGNLNYAQWGGDDYAEFRAVCSAGTTSTDEKVIAENTQRMIDLIQKDCVVYNFAVSKAFFGYSDKIVIEDSMLDGTGGIRFAQIRSAK